METNKLYLTILYLLLLCFFGYIIGCYLSNTTTVIREGARTYPRHVINPITKEDILDIKPLPPYHGETLNQLIDKIIAQYFDKRGYPYTNTIEKYSQLCIKNDASAELGVITEINKRRLADIGYYILNIIIPNIQTVDNPRPTVVWPAIQWTNDPTFAAQVQPTATYKIYKGQAWSSYGNEMDATTNTNANPGGGGTGGGGDTTSSPASSASASSTPDSSTCSDSNECRIACPGSCLDGIAAAWEETDKTKADVAKKEAANNTNASSFGGTSTTGFSQTNNIPGVASLKGGSNVLIIGDTTVDGFQTTDVEVDSSITLLNDNANSFINDYFIESGPNQGKPTQKAIDEFELYLNKNKTPMDGIHMNKMRDMVYYILQSIIPGLPTAQLPRAYVEWRPIHWLSRSEPK